MRRCGLGQPSDGPKTDGCFPIIQGRAQEHLRLRIFNASKRLHNGPAHVDIGVAQPQGEAVDVVPAGRHQGGNAASAPLRQSRQRDQRIDRRGQIQTLKGVDCLLGDRILGCLYQAE